MTDLDDFEEPLSQEDRFLAHYIIKLLKEHIMSQLTDALTALGTDIDEAIAALGTSGGNTATLQAELDAANADLAAAQASVTDLSNRLAAALPADTPPPAA